uniref:SOCS box domain-containing protein n=1 Tax=Gouania willdenowi TaxID=441366 RepID=A0A8C5E559_GOUWI
MPSFTGFRRVIHEYQPLVDAVLCVLGVDEGDGEAEDESAQCRSLVELLDRESHSEVFQEGISCALFKVAERGLVHAVEILLSYGANLNFEDPVCYCNPLHIAVLRNRQDIVRLLVKHGANIEKRERVHESSPLDHASEDSERTLTDTHTCIYNNDFLCPVYLGKTALLHALANSDGVTVQNTDIIQALLERGADVNAATVDGDMVELPLVLLVEDALQLLLTHGMVPNGCLIDGVSSMTLVSLRHFDLLFPLAVLLIQSGASMVCSHHGEVCWSAYGLLMKRLQTALQQCSDQTGASALLEQAEELLHLMRISNPTQHLAVSLQLSLPALVLTPMLRLCWTYTPRVLEHDASPAPLLHLCRASIRSHLQPGPLEDKVKALPLPDKLRDFLLPEDDH